jgi:hypothetical protein
MSPMLTPISSQATIKDYGNFLEGPYINFEQNTRLEGPYVIFKSEFSENTPKIKIPVRLLARYSTAFEKALLRVGFNESNVGDEVAILAEVEFAKLDQAAIKLILDYFKGEAVIIDLSSGEGNKAKFETFGMLVQLSSFAHLFGIDCLQGVAMHGLWHILVATSQQVTRLVVKEALDCTSSGCPARRLLKAVLKHKDKETSATARIRQILTSAITSSAGAATRRSCGASRSPEPRAQRPSDRLDDTRHL